MTSDAIWNKFIPKLGMGSNSNLSQLSTTSSLRVASRLSLSSRSRIPNGHQATLHSSISSPQTPSSKKIKPQSTPKSSSKKSTANSSVNTTPSSGLSQTKIVSYFSSSFKKPEKPKNSKCTEVNLDSDSNEDEIIFLCERERPKNSSVARKLFSEESLVKSCLKSDEQISSKDDTNVQNKENQDFTFQNTSSKSSKQGNLAEDVLEVPATMKPNATNVLQLVESTPVRPKDVPVIKNISHMSTVQVEKGDKFSSDALNLVNNDHNSVDKIAVASPTSPACSKTDKHVDRNAENLTLAEHPRGKNRHRRKETTEDPNIPHLSKINKHIVCKNTSARKEILSSQVPSTSTNISHVYSTHFIVDPHLTSMHDTVDVFTGVTECVSSLPSSGEMWQPSNPIGSNLSSDEFESEHVIKNKSGKSHLARKSVGKRKRLEHDSNKGAKISKCAGNKNKAEDNKGAKISKSAGNKDKAEDNKGAKISKCAGKKKKALVSNDSERKRSTKDPKIIKKPIEAKGRVVETTNNQNSVTIEGKPCIESITSDSSELDVDTEVINDLQENFQLSGGFFPEDEHSTRPRGHAFVIRTPSLQCDLSPFMDESYIPEDLGNIDSETDASSVVANVADIDEHCDDSFTKGMDGSTPNHGEHDETGVKDDSIFSSSTIIAPINDSENSCFLPNLVGKSIPHSEWNKLPEEENKDIESDVSLNEFLVREDENCSSNVSVSKTDSEDSSHSFELSDGDLEKLLEEKMPRSCSPQEAQEAPSEVSFDAQKAHQPHVSPEKKTTCSSDKMSSSPEIIDIAQELNQDKNCAIPSVNNDKSSEHVRKWVSQITIKSSVDIGDASNALRESSQSQALVKEKDSNIQQTNDTNSCINAETTVARMLKHSQDLNERVKSKSIVNKCNVSCQVKIIIKRGTMNERVVKKVDKENCRKENACPEESEPRFKKTAGALNVEVFEERGLVTEQDKYSRKKKGKNPSHKQSDEYYNDDQESYDVQKRPVKLSVKLGKWGWKELSIDCAPQKNKNDFFSSEDSAILGDETPMFLCIQDVHINMCKCSRSMTVNCFISKEELTETNMKSIYRSKYCTSLHEHLRPWGKPENPVTLSMTAYSELSTPEDMDSYSVPFSEKDTIILNGTQTKNMGSNEDKSSTGSINGNEAWTPSIENQTEKSKENGRELIQGAVTDSQETSMNDVPYHEYTAATPSDLSENFQDWLTPISTNDEELPKQTTADKWNDIMKMMRGRNGKAMQNSSTKPTNSLSSSTTMSGGFYRGGWNQNKSSERRNCPFYKLIDGTKFAVDAFSYGTIPGITHYFLSHYHYDHYMGLNRNFRHPIYCSSVTAKLIALKIKVDSRLIRRLDPGQTVVVDGTKVTALDANHCPGSVMFLFQLPGSKKVHLHVGDFRAHPCMESYHELWNVDIDRLYLDTTYCDPTYTFPSQQEAIESILTVVEEALEKEPKTLIVCGTYTIGKERVFAAIADFIKAKIWAPAAKRQILLCVKEGLEDLSTSIDVDIEGGAGRELAIANALNVLTTVKEEANIHVLSMNGLTVKNLENHLESIKGMKFNNVIAFRPTGWAQGRSPKGKNVTLVRSSSLVKIYEVAYSEHSSFLEMERFVKFVQPKTVIKTVNVGSEQQRKAMEKHINAWLSCMKTKRLLPNKCNDSPKSSRITEEQKKLGVFQPKRSVLQMKSNFLNPRTSLPLMGGASENSYDNMRTVSLPMQNFSSRSQETGTGSNCLPTTQGVKRMYPYKGGGPHKKHST